MKEIVRTKRPPDFRESGADRARIRLAEMVEEVGTRDRLSYTVFGGQPP